MWQTRALDIGHVGVPGLAQGVLGLLGDWELGEPGGAGVAGEGRGVHAPDGGVGGERREGHWVGAAVGFLGFDP